MESKRTFVIISLASIIIISTIVSVVAIILIQPQNNQGKNGVNHAPTLSNLPDQTLPEDSTLLNAFDLDDYASDEDLDNLSFSILTNSNPECGVNINAKNGINIIPDGNWTGTSEITVEVSDGELTDEKSFFVNVTNVNDAPFIKSFYPISDPTINDTMTLIFNISASDIDSFPLLYTWYVNNTPVGNNSAEYSFNASLFSEATYLITVNVSDGEYIIVKNWTLTVNDVNRAPTIEYHLPLSNPIIDEGNNQVFKISAVDLDGDPLSINWYIDGQLEQIGGNYTYTSDYESSGVYTVKVNVTDGQGVDEYSWTLTVNDVNRPPTLDDYYPTLDPTIGETESQYFNISVSDPDNDSITYNWYVNGSLQIEDGDNFTYSSDYDSAGVYIIKVNATDGEYVVDINWTLTVKDVNRAPTIDYYSPSSNPTIEEGESQNFNISASDADGDLLTINWYLDGDLVQTNGNYTYTSDYESNGSYTVKVNVTDGESVDEYSWILTINDVNRTPTLDDYYPTLDPTIDETESQYFNISVSDPDSDPITYNWFVNGVSQALNDYEFTYNTDYDSSGLYEIKANATDGQYMVDKIWTLTVNNVNRAPTIDYYSPLSSPTINEGECQNFNISASDADGDPLTINWYLDGSLEQTGGNYTYSSDYDSAGFYTVKVNVTDGQDVDDYSWTLTVNDLNRPPNITHSYPESLEPTIDENENQNFNITVEDLDGDSYNISWYVNGSLKQEGGNYTFATNYSSAGIYFVKVNITDGEDLDEFNWTLTVNNLICYTEIEIESKHTHTVDRDDKVAQLLDFNKSFYLYNISLYVIKLNSFSVTGNLTVELQGVNMLVKPNGTILYSKTIYNISEGWINVPMNAYYISEQTFVVSYISNSEFIAYYSVAHNGGTTDDEETLIDTGSGFTTIGADWDQTMNITIEWEETHLDKLNEPPVIDSYSPLTDPIIDEGENQKFTISASDPNYWDSLVYSWYVDGTKVGGNSNTYTFTTDYSSAEVYFVKVNVTDGECVAQHNWTLTVNNVICYTEVEIESGNTGLAEYDANVSQLLDLGKSFYLYNVTIHVDKSGTFPAFGNLTLEIRGVNIVNMPNSSVYYSITIYNISSGWINIPINGFYVSNKIYVVTYVKNENSPNPYALSHNSKNDDNEVTWKDTGSGWVDTDWDQTMNITVEYEETHVHISESYVFNYYEDHNYGFFAFLFAILLEKNSALMSLYMKNNKRNVSAIPYEKGRDIII